MSFDISQFQTIHAAVDEQVKIRPEAIAIVFEDEHITYGELDRRSNQLALLLKDMGVTIETPVAICLSRSPQLIIGLLAILKAGGNYIPLDSAQPEERLQFILKDTQASVLITSTDLVDRFSFYHGSFCLVDGCELHAQPHDISAMSCLAHPSQLAYVIYTSGSTGRPKGVSIQHDNVMRLFSATSLWFEFNNEDVFLLFHSYAFDFSVWEIWGALINGARLIIAGLATTRNTELVYELLVRESITIFNQTPSAFGQLVAYDSMLTSKQPLKIRSIIFGGEAPQLLPLKQWLEEHPHDPITLVNMYGITEITVHGTYKKITSFDIEQNNVTVIGEPIPDLQIHLLKSDLAAVAPSEEGEIYIGGKGLARCYLKRADLTADRFIPNPFGTIGEKIYRSGDIGKQLPNGQIDYKGRIDHQVKIRGHRVELSEIEFVLAECADIKRAVLRVVKDAHHNHYLIAYVVPGNTVLSGDENKEWLQKLREGASKKLPEYMLPSAFIDVDKIPLNSSGKVDFAALPSPKVFQRAVQEKYRAPQSKLQEELASIWSELLLIDKIGIDDHFFSLGGHSLLIMQVISKIRTRIHLQLPFRALFECPTIAKLSSRIEEDAQKYKPIEEIISHDRRNKFPLTAAQRGLWFFDRLVSLKGLYNIPIAYELSGRLCIEKLERALAKLFGRHDILKTRLQFINEEVFQYIDEAHLPKVVSHDFSKLAKQEKETQVFQHLHEEAYRPFDLLNDPLYRIQLITLEENKFLLLFVLHHIISDGWSMDILLNDLSTFYNNDLTLLPALPIHYFDVAIWEKKKVSNNDLNLHVEYWKTQLADAPNLLQLPSEHVRPPEESYNGATLGGAISENLYEKLKRISESSGATLYMTLLAAFQILLHKNSGQNRVVIGTPIANRQHPQMEEMCGFLVNSIPICASFETNATFASFLQVMRDKIIEAHEHQDLPFEQLVDRLGIQRDLSRHPIFQVMFVLENHKKCALQLQDLSIKKWNLKTPYSRFDLTLWVEEQSHQLSFTFEYATDLFSEPLVDALSKQFVFLLSQIADHPQNRISDLSILSQTEKQFLLNQAQGSLKKDFAETALYEPFQVKVGDLPDKIALAFGEEHLSFYELNARANQLAHTLQAMGLGSEKAVAIFLERSPELFIAIMAAIKLGVPYVILDLHQPKDRLAHIIMDSQALCVVTESTLKEKLPVHGKLELLLDLRWEEISESIDKNLNVMINPSVLAYIIYTSGSTGIPKGVAVTHKNLMHYLSWFKEQYAFSSDDRFDCSSSLSFDLSVTSFLVPFLYGGTVYLCSEEAKRDLVLYLDHIKKQKITFLKSTPGYFGQFKAFAKQNDDLHNLRYIILGGEAVNAKDVLDWLTMFPTQKIVNEYGPTETTVGVSAEEASIKDKDLERSSMSIGRPGFNCELFVLDRHYQLVPVGVVGELYIAGDFLARGYIRRPDLTSDKFLPHPFSNGKRIYKAGDLVKYLSSGKLDYLGRVDNQVKIRGYRIELSEIESVLKSHEQVSDAIVSLHQEKSGQKRIVAYAIPKNKEMKDALGGTLREYLLSKLPEYMIPTCIMFLDSFPLAASDKIDHKALPAPDFQSRQYGAGYIAPRTGLELSLCEIWSELLGVAEIGVQDNFFEVGGDSIISIQLVSRARQKGIYFEIKQVFQYPTIEKLALVAKKQPIHQENLSGTDAINTLSPSIQEWIFEQNLIHNRDEIEEVYPLSPIQEGLLFTALYHPASDIYFTQRVFELQGKLDVKKFTTAWQQIIDLYPILRTAFHWQGLEKPLQVILKTVPCLMELRDWSTVSSLQIEEKLSEALELDRQDSIELSKAPLMRFQIVKINERTHYFVWSFHHLLLDGWSVSLIIKKLMALYFDKPVGERAPKYKHFINWLLSQDENQAKQFWLAYLTDYEAPTSLSSIGLSRDVGTERESYKVSETVISLEETAGIKNFVRAHGITLNTLLQAAWGILLSFYTQRNDLLFGVTVSGRSIPIEQVEEMVGIFINTIPFRMRLSPEENLLSLMLRIQNEMAELYKYSHISLAKIQNWLGGKENRTLFDTIFVCENFPRDNGLEESQELKWTSVKDFEKTEYPCMLSVIIGECLTVQMSYDPSHLSTKTINALVNHLLLLIRNIVNAPHTNLGNILPISLQESETLLREWNNTAIDFPNEECLPHLFKKQAEKAPDRVAAVYQNLQITYGELERRASGFALALQKLGIAPENKVIVSLHPSLELLSAMLGVFKAGGIYIPLDPMYPQERINYILKDAAPSIIIASEKDTHLFKDFSGKILRIEENFEPNVELTLSPLHPHNAAYLIYTSGSTGNPKGIIVEHASLCNCLHWLQHSYPLNSHEIVLQQTAITFDVSIEEMLWPICNGSKVVILPSDQRLDIPSLIRTIVRNKITFLEFVPSLLHAFLEEESIVDCQSLRTVFVGGEALPPRTAEQFLKKLDVKLINVYGPTETTIDASSYEVTLSDFSQTGSYIPIGKPNANSTMYILNSSAQLLPLGLKGELYISGKNLARGYLNRPDLTAEKFLPNPYLEASRLYKTNDVACYLPDGNIEFCGRSDFQIKLRGFRIELEEIEEVLLRHVQVDQVLVTACEGSAGQKELVAYIVGFGKLNSLDGAHVKEKLKTHLNGHLPNYMIPSLFVFLEKMPVTHVGKIDRKALPIPEIHERQSNHPFVPPENDLEKALQECWTEVLGIKEIGIHDNFFELGGDSIISIQLVSKARQKGIQFEIKELFLNSTIAKLASIATWKKPEVQIKKTESHADEIPLTPIQHWFFQQNLKNSSQYNQSVLLQLKQRIDLNIMRQALDYVVNYHDVFRFRYEKLNGVWHQFYSREPAKVAFESCDILEMEKKIETLEASLDIENGPLIRAAVFDGNGSRQKMFLAAHHLIIDGVSWRILLEDLEMVYKQLADRKPPSLPAKTSSYFDWSMSLQKYAQSAELKKEIPYWHSQPLHTRSDYVTR